ncbi:MAG: isochorismatase family protein [Actinobacteria bacterium]|nr:isochorismatase family protein [Actinomycetota bacterium]
MAGGVLDDDPMIVRYRELGVGVEEVGMGRRPALLIVDFQRAFTEGPLASEHTGAALATTAELLGSARELGVPVIFVHVVYEDEEEIGRVWRAKGHRMVECLRGRAGAEIDPRVAPRAGELVLEKKRASAFYGTELDAILERHQIDSFIVCGTSTSGCVRATVVDGAARDYSITVVADATDDRDPTSREATLVDVQAKYGDVVSLADAIGRMQAAMGGAASAVPRRE